jgi:lysophospholipid acyltransferase (LPLAT)-like uncharacterized protein
MKIILKTIFKKIAKLDAFQSIVAAFGAFYIYIVFKSIRWTRVNWEIPLQYIGEGRGFITCFWHNRLLLSCFGWPGEKEFHMLISGHKDGRMIAKTVEYHGIKTIAGSKGKNGSQALRAMIKILNDGHTVGITPDGPRGPLYSVSDGILTLARIAKVDIIPFSYSCSRFKILRSWDKFRLALPFGNGVLMWGQPFRLNLEKSIEEQRIDLQKHLMSVASDADNIIGVKEEV